MNVLYLTILFPLIGYLLLAFLYDILSKTLVTVIGVGSVGISALISVFVGLNFFQHGQHPFIETLWTWIHVNDFNIKVNLLLDGLSLTMMLIITGVGFFIHVFASWYMHNEDGYSRFFAYTNLFIASMLTLVLAENLMLMYLGWELVGLCSYLLIGFYYKNIDNCKASIKAFITTRIGDIFLSLAIFILYTQLGTLNFHEMLKIAPIHFTHSSHILQWVTLMLLCGAIGKSAQLPLHTWLVDAMAGPTPVSALIHAATMVTAGVYLISRTYSLFMLTPAVLNLVGIVGASTLIVAGFSALVQTNIKRILAYSTMSQIGYMFLALGVQAWNAAIFHLIIHAFFKALLFLSAGSVILCCNHEQNIFNMGGLRKRIPFVYFCFLVGGSSLAALPLITSGFYSKEEILFGVFTSGHINLIVIALLGSFLTSLYTFRMIFVIFHGEVKIHATSTKKINHTFPLIVLLILSTVIGAFFSPHLSEVLPHNEFEKNGKIALEIISGTISIIGILTAGILWLGKRKIIITISSNKLSRFLNAWWFVGWGFDWIYNKVFVKAYIFIAYLLRHDPLNSLMNIIILIARVFNKFLVMSENGYLRWYLASISIGAVIMLSFIINNI